jgi:hypothetical protein
VVVGQVRQVRDGDERARRAGERGGGHEVDVRHRDHAAPVVALGVVEHVELLGVLAGDRHLLPQHPQRRVGQPLVEPDERAGQRRARQQHRQRAVDDGQQGHVHGEGGAGVVGERAAGRVAPRHAGQVSACVLLLVGAKLS